MKEQEVANGAWARTPTISSFLVMFILQVNSQLFLGFTALGGASSLV